MILTKCAACAAPLALDAPRCVRCKTRYCNATCQHDHWRRGHKQICKKIHRGGNAEQYHANQKYKEAVAEAVEACADDTMLASRANPTDDIFRDIFYAEKILGEDAENARRVLGPTKDIVIDMQRDLTLLRKLIAHLPRKTP